MMPTWSELPKRCPFCFDTGVTWREFKLRTYVERYIDAETLGFSAPRDEDFDLWCTRCNEHIRKEDIGEQEVDDLSPCCHAGIMENGRCAECKENVR